MPSTTDLNYIHTFVPAPPDSSRPVTLLLLHGTGGDENSLLSLGKNLWPGAALLGLRGKVLENGMPPSFRRFTEVGIGDVRSRTEELARFVRAASERYGFSARRLIVVGYSNGANLAASLDASDRVRARITAPAPKIVAPLTTVFISHLDKSACIVRRRQT